MTDPHYVRKTLVNRTNADSVERIVENNRFHYVLSFDLGIGWDWLYGQVHKAESDIGESLELWKVKPGGDGRFLVEVREVARREGIDDEQNSLTEFER